MAEHKYSVGQSVRFTPDRNTDASARSLGMGLGPRRPGLGPVPGRRASAAGVCVWLLPSLLFIGLWLPSLCLRLWVPSVFLRLWRLLPTVLPGLLPSRVLRRISSRPTRCDPPRSLALRPPAVSCHKSLHDVTRFKPEQMVAMLCGRTRLANAAVAPAKSSSADYRLRTSGARMNGRELPPT